MLAPAKMEGLEVFRVLRVGTLVGIGAPNWHDLLKNLVSLRALLPVRREESPPAPNNPAGGQAGGQAG